MLGLYFMTITQLQLAPALIDQVHDRLLAAIVDGTLAPGQRLTQESAAEMLGVSRQPVSHALQVLKRRGLLIEHGRRGLAVAPIDGKRIRDLYQVREQLDGLAARLSAERVARGKVATNEIEAMQFILAGGARLDGVATIAELIDADVEFHSAIHRLSGNPAVTEMVAEQWPHFMRSMGLVLTAKGMRNRVWREHADILDAIRSGNARRAEACARAHTARAADETARRFESIVSVA
jgi:DNA-binding GntR family transcriptional regulator